MSTRTPKKEIERTVKLWHKALADGFPATSARGSMRKSALRIVHDKLGLAGNNANRTKTRLDTALALGMKVAQWGSSLSQEREAEIRRTYGIAEPAPVIEDCAVVRPSVVTDAHFKDLVARIPGALKRKPGTVAELAERLGVSSPVIEEALKAAHVAGATVVERAGKWFLDDAPPLGIQQTGRLVLTTDKDGYFEFGACSDEHLCSKYERLDCLNEYYDQIARRGITTVLNAGNWIDGEATFNRHDLRVHGMDEQMQYLAREYPRREGVNIHAITGADHEGWYARREGIDVGRYAENVMRQAGRTDWHDLGYMEAFVSIVHKESGKSSNICVMHPGGGSSYAVSYAPQKVVESFDGGDKPAVLLIGHYHKSGYNLIRNVHTMQTGTFMDQSIFMRQKKLSAHVGGCFVKIHVDPYTGAVDECAYTFRNYFVREYYNGRWSQHGQVAKAPRSWKAKG